MCFNFERLLIKTDFFQIMDIIMNKRTQTVCRTLLAVMALLGSSTAMAQKVDQWVDGIHYEMNENTNGEVVVTEAYVSDGADVVLLDEIMASDGVSYPVTVIGKAVFTCNYSSGIRITSHALKKMLSMVVL